MASAIKEHVEKHEECVERKFTKFTICRIRYSITYLVTFSYKSGYYIKRPLLSRLCCTKGYTAPSKMTFSIAPLSIKCLFVTLSKKWRSAKMTLIKNDTHQKWHSSKMTRSKNDTHQKWHSSKMTRSKMTLSITALWHYAKSLCWISICCVVVL
jgi:hypothetical protein